MGSFKNRQWEGYEPHNSQLTPPSQKCESTRFENTFCTIDPLQFWDRTSRRNQSVLHPGVCALVDDKIWTFRLFFMSDRYRYNQKMYKEAEAIAKWICQFPQHLSLNDKDTLSLDKKFVHEVNKLTLGAAHVASFYFGRAIYFRQEQNWLRTQRGQSNDFWHDKAITTLQAAKSKVDARIQAIYVERRYGFGAACGAGAE